MVPNNEISDILSQLDPDNDEHWTSEGLPRMEVLEARLERQVKRKDVTDAWPDFTRELARSIDPLDQAQDPSPAQPVVDESLVQAQPMAAEDDDQADQDDQDDQEPGSRAEIQAEIDAGIARVAEIDAEIHRLGRERLEVDERVQHALEERDTRFPPLSEGAAMKAYLESQFQQRLARFAGRVPDAKAPIDASRGRRGGPASQRIIYPVNRGG